MHNEDEPLIPKKQVLKDMYEDSGVERAARSYYYMYYATEEEKKKMDKQDKIADIIVYGIFAIGCITIACGVGFLFGKLFGLIF